MKALLHTVFRFPDKSAANAAFVTSVINLFQIPILVVDRKMKVHLVNIQGQDMLFRFDADAKRWSASESGGRTHSVFPASLREPIRACIKKREPGFLGEFVAPGVRSSRYNLVLCPGEIQGAKFCFLLMVPPTGDPRPDMEAVPQAVLDSINGVALLFDTDLGLRGFNRRYLEEFRLTAEEAREMRISEFNPSPQGRILETQIKHLMEADKVRNSKADVVTARRRGMVVASVLAWPLRSGADKVTGLFVMLQPTPGSVPLSLMDEKTRELFGETAIRQGPPMFFTQMDGRIITMNMGARTLLKQGADLGASDLKSALPWGQPDVIDHLYADLLAGANCSALHTDIETPTGRRVLAVQAYGLKEIGEITSIVLVHLQDVTEVEQSRNMLADTAHRLATDKEILERVLRDLHSVKFSYAVVDRELNLLRISDSAMLRAGNVSGGFVGKKIYEVFPAVRETGVIAYVKTAIERGQSIRVDRMAFEFPGGEKGLISGYFHPITLDGKKACLLVSENLTEMEARDRELDEASRRLRSLMESLEEGVAILDRNGDIVEANHIVYEGLGMTRDQVVGKNEHDLMMVEEGDLLMDFRRRSLLKRQAVRTGCIRLTSKVRDATVFADLSYIPLLGAGGAVEETLTIIRYLTDVVNLERKVEDYTNNLQRLVRERTAELSSANEQLGTTVEKLASMARSGMVLSSLKDRDSVMDSFLKEAAEVLGADFVSVALITSSNGSSRTTFYSEGKTPPPGAVPSEVVEQNLARLSLGGATKPALKPNRKDLLIQDFSFSGVSGLMLAWKEEGEFSAIDRNLSGLLCTQLNFSLPITTYVGDLRMERDRSRCLRRIAFRTAAAKSVASAIGIVAEELSKVIVADRFFWMVSSDEQNLWLSEVTGGAGAAGGGRIHLAAEQTGCLGAMLGACHESHDMFCDRFPDFGGERFRGEGTVRLPGFCSFSKAPDRDSLGRCFRELLRERELIPQDEGSIALAPVMLSDKAYGMLCAYNEMGVPFEVDETCFMCLAASTVGHMWQAADASRSIRKLEAEGETLGELAHDLKYPLARIREILERRWSGGKTGKRGLKALEDITSEINTLQLLTEELIDISNRKGREPELVDLREVIGRCIALMCDQESGPRIDLEDCAGLLPPPAFANRKDIKNILISVLANCAEAAGDRGWVKVAVGVSDSGAPGSTLDVVVTDSGPGVPDNLMVRIFDPFFSTKEGGKGIGLFSAKKRAHANGGDVRCEPGENGRSRFVISLPLASG